MKRKKWSELEEKTLLTKYSELVRTGALSKLKTREKKFKPIAEHVNAAHHLLSPVSFPFRWTWRDVSVKIQNMRHQYLGVRQKIRVSDNDFGWADGDDHWENFSLYREVFGDVELEEKEGERESGSEDELGIEVVRLQEAALRRDERRREREEEREGKRQREHVEDVDTVMEWQKRESERRARVEWEIEEERRRKRRRETEERREEEEMAWRERVVGMQVEHEKQMMQMHAEACHNQMQIIGAMARLLSQFFAPPTDALGALPPQVLGHHPDDGLGGDGKPDSNSPSEFL